MSGSVNKALPRSTNLASLKGCGRLFTADDKRSLYRRESHEYHSRGLLCSFEKDEVSH
jgi:hypothetical protein